MATQPTRGTGNWETRNITVCSGRLASSPAVLMGPRQKGQHRYLGTHMESTVPVPPAPGSAEGQGGTQTRDPSLCSVLHPRYHAAARETFRNSSCERFVTLQSTKTALISPPDFLTYHLFIPPGPALASGQEAGSRFQWHKEAAFPVEQVHGSAHPRGFYLLHPAWSRAVLRAETQPVCHPWGTRKGDTLAKSGAGSRPRGQGLSIPERGVTQHYHCSAAIPLKGAPVMNH